MKHLSFGRMFRYFCILILQWHIYGAQDANSTSPVANNTSTALLSNTSTAAISIPTTAIPPVPIPLLISLPNVTNGFLSIPCGKAVGTIAEGRAGRIRFTRRDLLDNPTFYVRHLAWASSECSVAQLKPQINLEAAVNYVEVLLITARTVNATTPSDETITMINSCPTCPAFNGSTASFYPAGEPVPLTRDPISWTSSNGDDEEDITFIQRVVRFQYTSNTNMTDEALDEVVFQLDYVAAIRSWMSTDDVMMLYAIYESRDAAYGYCDTTKQFLHYKYCTAIPLRPPSDTTVTCPSTPLSMNMSSPTLNATNKRCLRAGEALLQMGINPSRQPPATTPRITTPKSLPPVTIYNGGNGVTPDTYWNTTRILAVVMAVIGIICATCTLIGLTIRCVEKRNARKAVLRNAAIAEQEEINGTPYIPAQPRLFGAMPSSDSVPMTADTSYQNSPCLDGRKNSDQYSRFT
ncbi:uncharacterized protein LOC129583988 [Paramacrobiotus metropolitanus]|uniref:uncharacterized protein LOC129583988 n=1 Tax=Paramacrobiotus metropolitanus TaxID=2943436 RepID=UPI00244647BC|nr:uncharacterized protein LOC129583988 [Paramacrobiotus metropolitanus]